MDRYIFDELSFPLAILYEQFGLGLQQTIIEHLQKDRNIEDIEEWYNSRIADSTNVREDGIALLQYLFSDADEQLQTLIYEAVEQANISTNPIAQQIIDSGKQIPVTGQTRSVENQAYRRLSQYLNLTNATMLDGLDNKYRGILREVVQDVRGNQLTKPYALVRAIESFSREDMPAFIDKAGREWSPEAYIRMVVETETSNLYRDSIFAKADEWGEDLFYISAHRGARELCEPYQGILCSRSNKRGVAEDINGEKILYIPFSDTSYGESAGIFGINCHHYPIIFIPQISEKLQPLAEEEKVNNERNYQESQQQRYIERMIRKWKSTEYLLEQAGLDTSKASDKVKEWQSTMRDFINTTGRTRRSDREQVFSNQYA